MDVSVGRRHFEEFRSTIVRAVVAKLQPRKQLNGGKVIWVDYGRSVVGGKISIDSTALFMLR